MFDTVWPLISTSTCLVTKQCLMAKHFLFGQGFRPGLKKHPFIFNLFLFEGHQYSELDGSNEQRDGDKHCVRGASERVFRGTHGGNIKQRIVQCSLQAITKTVIKLESNSCLAAS